jgi:hypothetical protein
MTKARNGSRSSARQGAGMLAAAAITGAGAAAALLDRIDLALAALALANGLILVGLLRVLVRGARSGEVAGLVTQVRALSDGMGRLEQDLDALRERAEFADQRLLAMVERERLAAEERHHELLQSIANAPRNSEAAHLEEPVRGGR